MSQNLLAGITRAGGHNQAFNPGGTGIQGETLWEVVGPDGTVKDFGRSKNTLVEGGLERLQELVATGGNASSWVDRGYIGTSTTAASSTQTAMVASTASVSLGGAAMSVSDLGARTVEYQQTYSSNNPAGAAAINEVGLANSGTLIARSVLGTASINKGASDEIRISHRIVFTTA